MTSLPATEMSESNPAKSPDDPIVMKYRFLGKARLQVPEIGFGAWGI